jgi:hypothetical protein
LRSFRRWLAWASSRELVRTRGKRRHGSFFMHVDSPLSTRVTKRELDEISQGARREGMTRSGYVRALVLMGLAVTGNEFAAAQLKRGLTRLASILDARVKE